MLKWGNAARTLSWARHVALKPSTPAGRTYSRAAAGLEGEGLLQTIRCRTASILCAVVARGRCGHRKMDVEEDESAAETPRLPAPALALPVSYTKCLSTMRILQWSPNSFIWFVKFIIIPGGGGGASSLGFATTFLVSFFTAFLVT